MIKNERQYKITKAQAVRFSNALESLRQHPDADTSLHPLIAKAQEDAISSQLADLESELREYESLKAGEFQWDSLRMVADLPSILIKARIAQGLSQKDLAERIGLKEQPDSAVRGHRLRHCQSSPNQGSCKCLWYGNE